MPAAPAVTRAPVSAAHFDPVHPRACRDIFPLHTLWLSRGEACSLNAAVPSRTDGDFKRYLDVVAPPCPPPHLTSVRLYILLVSESIAGGARGAVTCQHLDSK